MCFMQTESVLQTKNQSEPVKNWFSVALVTIVAKYEAKNVFGIKKYRLAKTSGKWQKPKIILPKNRHLNITNLVYFMPFNRQLTN